MDENKLTFEEALNKLQEAVSKLEDGKVKLDEAFNLFENGIKYAHICEEKIKSIEENVTKIIKDNKEEDYKEN